MRARPSWIWRWDRSSPVNRAPGKRAASGMMLPPAAQPSSSTRARSAAGAGMPNSAATAASRAGWVSGNGIDG